MKKIALHLATLTVLGSAPLFANALSPETMAKPPAVEALPAGAQVVSLDVQPAKIVINGKYEAAQIVVIAKLASGVVVYLLVIYDGNGSTASSGSGMRRTHARCA